MCRSPTEVNAGEEVTISYGLGPERQYRTKRSSWSDNPLQHCMHVFVLFPYSSPRVVMGAPEFRRMMELPYTPSLM